jgi:hypothetical protein
MNAFSHPDPGTELDWLAMDMDEYVGLFSTGGHGPVPAAVVANLDVVVRAVASLKDLPVRGDCASTPDRATGNFSFWIEPCQRGLFGFDWGPVEGGPFARLTVPKAPIKAGDIAESVVREATQLVQLSIRFALAPYISHDELGVPLYRR